MKRHVSVSVSAEVGQYDISISKQGLTIYGKDDRLSHRMPPVIHFEPEEITKLIVELQMLNTEFYDMSQKAKVI